MTKHEILERMEAGEPLRWISRHVSGKKVTKKFMLGFRDLFLGRQQLGDDDCVLVMSMEESGDLIIEYDKHNKKHVITYSIP